MLDRTNRLVSLYQPLQHSQRASFQALLALQPTCDGRFSPKHIRTRDRRCTTISRPSNATTLVVPGFAKLCRLVGIFPRQLRAFYPDFQPTSGFALQSSSRHARFQPISGTSRSAALQALLTVQDLLPADFGATHPTSNPARGSHTAMKQPALPRTAITSDFRPLQRPLGAFSLLTTAHCN